MTYSSHIDHVDNTWEGTASIPFSYIPKDADRMNAYAIHGSANNRTYESLYPTPKGKYPQPDL